VLAQGLLLIYRTIMKQADLVIRNGRIIDPATGKDFLGDIAVHEGRILSLEKGLQVKGEKEFDASGCIVTPGLIDCHVHCYQYATPLGVDPDSSCLSRGVTTVVDGGSAGTWYSTNALWGNVRN